MYKGQFILPHDSDGAPVANYVDADGYHQSVKQLWLPSWRSGGEFTITTGAVNGLLIFNNSTTLLLIIQKLFVSISKISGTGSTFTWGRLDRATAYTGGTAAGTMVPMDTSQAVTADFVVLKNPTTVTGANTMDFWHLGLSATQDVAGSSMFQDGRMIEHLQPIGNGAPLILRQNQGVHFRLNVAGAADIFIQWNAYASWVDNS